MDNNINDAGGNINNKDDDDSHEEFFSIFCFIQSITGNICKEYININIHIEYLINMMHKYPC